MGGITVMDQALILSQLNGLLVGVFVHLVDALGIHFAPVNSLGCLVGAVRRLRITIRELCVCFSFRTSAPEAAFPAPPLLALLAGGQEWFPGFRALRDQVIYCLRANFPEPVTNHDPSRF